MRRLVRGSLLGPTIVGCPGASPCAAGRMTLPAPAVGPHGCRWMVVGAARLHGRHISPPLPTVRAISSPERVTGFCSPFRHAYRIGMNTNRTGMRTVLAAAAAGALIMGSAAGAMAASPKDEAGSADDRKHAEREHQRATSPIDLNVDLRSRRSSSAQRPGRLRQGRRHGPDRRSDWLGSFDKEGGREADRRRRDHHLSQRPCHSRPVSENKKSKHFAARRRHDRLERATQMDVLKAALTAKQTKVYAVHRHGGQRRHGQVLDAGQKRLGSKRRRDQVKVPCATASRSSTSKH